MKREQIVEAAYLMCLAMGQAPSSRNVASVIHRQLGYSFRRDFILRHLRLSKRSLPTTVGRV